MIRAASKPVVFAGSIVLGLTAVFAAACSSSDDAPRSTPTEEDASLPDAGTSSDSGARDASRPDVLVDATAPVVQCATTPCAVEIAAGFDSACVRLSDGTVQCWGSNGSGQLGRPSEDAAWSNTPAPVVGLSEVTQISGSGSPPGDVYCARKVDGTAVCWGANANGVLGRKIGDDVDVESSPVVGSVDGLGAVTGVYAGYYLSCATLSAGDVACWGSNDAAQIPNHASDAGALFPTTTFSVGGNGQSLGIADRGTIALTESGLVSWGLSGDPVGPRTGILGREASTAVAQPGPIELSSVSAVAASAGRACAIANGRVFCWGVGPIPGSDSVYPAFIGVGTEDSYAQTLTVGPRTACVTLSSGAASCWGDNTRGQLGGGDFDYQRRAVRVQKLAAKAVRMAAMESATCAILESGAVQCWGHNDRGQLGTGTTDGVPHLEPQNVKLAP